MHPWMRHPGINAYARLPHGVGWEAKGWEPVDGEPSDADLAAQEPAEPGSFDPSAHTVAEVQEYLGSAGIDERGRVLAAESAAQNRKSIG